MIRIVIGVILAGNGGLMLFLMITDPKFREEQVIALLLYSLMLLAFGIFLVYMGAQSLLRRNRTIKKFSFVSMEGQKRRAELPARRLGYGKPDWEIYLTSKFIGFSDSQYTEQFCLSRRQATDMIQFGSRFSKGNVIIDFGKVKEKFVLQEPDLYQVYLWLDKELPALPPKESIIAWAFQLRFLGPMSSAILCILVIVPLIKILTSESSEATAQFVLFVPGLIILIIIILVGYGQYYKAYGQLKKIHENLSKRKKGQS